MLYITQLTQQQIDAINAHLAELDRQDLIFTPEKLEHLKQLQTPNGDPLGLIRHPTIVLCGRMYDLDNGHHVIPCNTTHNGGIVNGLIVDYDFNVKTFATGYLANFATVVIPDAESFPI